MARKLRPLDNCPPCRLEWALRELRGVRDNLGGAPGALAAVRRAIKSVEGALRHAHRVEFRASIEALPLMAGEQRHRTIQETGTRGR